MFSLLAPLFLAAGAAPAVPVEVVAQGPQGDLHGLLQPAGEGASIVLIIPGSGPTDRDGNSPLGVKAAPYRLLAEGLAVRGIATVRIDKRGMFTSKVALADPNAVTIADYVSDTTNWVAATRKATGATCVWVLGHSEGGLVALATVNAHPEGICGTILVAAAGRPLGEVLKEQLRTNPFNAPLLPAAEAAIDSLAAGKPIAAADLPTPLLPLLHPRIQGYLMSNFALDPAKLAASTKLPLAILQGTHDIQVSMADAERLKAANPAARLLPLTDTNHVLKQVTADDRTANAATYADPDLPLAPGVIDAITSIVSGGQAPTSAFRDTR